MTTIQNILATEPVTRCLKCDTEFHWELPKGYCRGCIGVSESSMFNVKPILETMPFRTKDYKLALIIQRANVRSRKREIMILKEENGKDVVMPSSKWRPDTAIRKSRITGNPFKLLLELMP